MYTPEFIKRQNQYTTGGEYMLYGQEYIGYYNITAQGPYTGRVYDDKEQKLFTFRTVFNTQSQLYVTLAEQSNFVTDLQFDDPVTIYVAPTPAHYKQGFFIRYFIQQRNDKQARIKELDKEQFDKVPDAVAGINPNFYKSVSLRWKLKGPEFDIKKRNVIITPGVRDTNTRTVLEQDTVMVGLYLFLQNRLAEYTPYDDTDRNSNTDIKL